MKFNYIVLASNDLVTLQNQVNDQMDDGYEPKGGLLGIPNKVGSGAVYYQAMVLLPIQDDENLHNPQSSPAGQYPSPPLSGSKL